MLSLKRRNQLKFSIHEWKILYYYTILKKNNLNYWNNFQKKIENLQINISKYFLIILKFIVIQYVVTDYNINSYRNITNHNFSSLHFTVNME